MHQNLFLDVLESAPTKREARAYLSRFGPSKIKASEKHPQLMKSPDAGINLGNLYSPIRPFIRDPILSHKRSQLHYSDTIEHLHIALVKIRAPQSIDEVVLQGLGHTLSSLSRLGLGCVVVFDLEHGQKRDGPDSAKLAEDQADRIVNAVNSYGNYAARRVDSVIGVASATQHLHSAIKLKGEITIAHRNLLLSPLRKGLIPVIAPIGYVLKDHTKLSINADEVVLALTRDFAGIQPMPASEQDPKALEERIENLQKQITLDRIIVLDPLGGIPSTERLRGSHVFINLEQEFDKVKRELLSDGDTTEKTSNSVPPVANDSSKAFALSNPSSKFQANETSDATEKDQSTSLGPESQFNTTSMRYHLGNLELCKNTLALLPSTSSAFIAAPQMVVSSESRLQQESQDLGVGTRRKRNPLIHNLLTDKPAFSSSLPFTRAQLSTQKSSSSTFLKRGMPVTIIPDPSVQPWNPHSSAASPLELSDPRIDLPRLIHLIEDSFNRKLDVAHYLSRIKNRIAGVIIAGEYEGGALLTWEPPPNAPSDAPEHMVPYLDKFAVLKRSQGAGGVADIVFKAMARDCFPKGVCWRSRMENPVNGWYFERAKGTWKMPGTNWTMFWTTEDVERGEVLLSYEEVCKSVVPSWADKKSVAD